MKQPLFALLALGAIVLTASQTGPSRAGLMEYFAVSPDGPFSYLPETPGGAAPALADVADLDGNPEIITPEEARMAGLLLDVLAGDPSDPHLQDAPLDGPDPSDSAVIVAGL